MQFVAERVEMGVSQAVAGNMDTVAVPFLILFGGGDLVLVRSAVIRSLGFRGITGQ